MEMELQVEKELEKEVNYKDMYNGMGLKVYIDEENDKYYITVFAASELYFIDYKTACDLADRGGYLFEITKEQLNRLQEIFKDRIIYITINTNLIEKNGPYDETYDDKYNYVGDDIKDAYDNYKIESYKLNGYNDDLENYIKSNDEKNEFKL